MTWPDQHSPCIEVNRMTGLKTGGVNSDMKSNGVSIIVSEGEERTGLPAQHAGWSGLGWPGLVESSNFLP